MAQITPVTPLSPLFVFFNKFSVHGSQNCLFITECSLSLELGDHHQPGPEFPIVQRPVPVCVSDLEIKILFLSPPK